MKPKPKNFVNVAKKALLFDLDGTLIDSLDDLVSAINRTMEQNGFAPLSRDAVSRFIGKGSRILVEKALRSVLGQTPPKEITDSIHRQYLTNMLLTQGRYTRCFDGLHESLTQFQNLGFSLALVTNKPRANTLQLLKQLELEKFFPVVVAGDDTPHPKPAPDILFSAMRQLGVESKDCIMIGDSMNDAQAALEAGSPCFLLQTGYNEGINIADWAKIHAPESLVFANIKDIVSYLSQ